MVQDQEASSGWLARWNRMPLCLRILLAMTFGVLLGLVLGERAEIMEILAKVVLQLLGALAPPAILIAVIHVLMTTELREAVAGRLIWLLILNTSVAILIGLAVASVVRPDRWSSLKPPEVSPGLERSRATRQPAAERIGHAYSSASGRFPK